MNYWVGTMAALLIIDLVGKLIAVLDYEHGKRAPRWALVLDLVTCVMMTTWYVTLRMTGA